MAKKVIENEIRLLGGEKAIAELRTRIGPAIGPPPTLWTRVLHVSAHYFAALTIANIPA